MYQLAERGYQVISLLLSNIWLLANLISKFDDIPYTDLTDVLPD